MLRERLATSSANVQRAIVQTFARHPTAENVAPLTALAESAESGADLELKHALRVALREQLQSPGIYAALPNPFPPASATLLAEVSLAVPSPESAAFLLRALTDLDFQSPRAGEFLGHVAQYLPVAQIGELALVVEKLRAAPFAQQFALADGLSRAARKRKLTLPKSADAWMQRTLFAGLESTAAAEQDRAIAALHDSEDAEKFAPLRRLIDRVPRIAGSRRAAALAALANLPGVAEVLARAVADGTDSTLALKAAGLISTRGDIALATAALPAASGSVTPVLARGLAGSDAGFGELLALIDQGKVAPAVLRNASVSELANQRAQALRDRAASLTKNLPPDDARLEALITLRVTTFRNRKNDAKHGGEIFRANCIACHKFRDEGASLAPNLDGIGARGAERLAEDILDPSRNVDAAFRQTIIETKDGRTLAGINLRETADSLSVTDAASQILTVPRAEMKSQLTSGQSLMPGGLDAIISENDFADLLAYLLQP